MCVCGHNYASHSVFVCNWGGGGGGERGAEENITDFTCIRKIISFYVISEEDLVRRSSAVWTYQGKQVVFESNLISSIVLDDVFPQPDVA